MNADQLRYLVIRPTLERLQLWSHAAEELLMGTAAQESKLGRFLKQHPSGPALGIYQCEPTTHGLVIAWMLKHRPALALAVRELAASADLPPHPSLAGQMVWNLAYATAIARVLYLSIPRPLPDAEDLEVPRPLPDAEDLEGQARYWKQHYNTPKGKGKVEEYVASYRALVKA